MTIYKIWLMGVGKLEKIAILSDVHGNIPALEAVLNDIRKRKVNRVICLGDIVGKGPCPDIAIDIIMEACDVIIRGNWEEGIISEFQCDNLKWHKDKIGKERLDYLKNLPFSIDFFTSGRLIRLFHASPINTFHRVQEWAPFNDRLAMFVNTKMTKEGSICDLSPNVVGYGDVHHGFVQNFNGKTLFNVGSVGNPLDIPQASYAILEGAYGSRQLNSFSIHLVRVPYNIDLAINEAKDSNMPQLDEYISELRTARYRGLKK